VSTKEGRARGRAGGRGGGGGRDGGGGRHRDRAAAGLEVGRDRPARVVLGLQLAPGAVGDHLVEALVQRGAQGAVALGHGEGGRLRAELLLHHHDLAAAVAGELLADLGRGDPGVGGLGLELVDGTVVIGHPDRVELLLGREVVLHGALHDGHPLAGQVVEALDRRALGHIETEIAEVVTVAEVDGLLARLGDGDRGAADIELVGVDLRQQRREVGAGELDLQPDLAGHRGQQVVVETGELAVLEEDVGRRVGERAGPTGPGSS
jgi:hypothetical protein